MKNTMKKIAGLALAMVMALSLTAPAFADETETNTEPSITITNPVAGQVYNLYKIFDMTSKTTGEGDDATTTYSYEVNTDWTNFFKTTNEAGETSYNYLVVEPAEGQNIPPVPFDGKDFYINITENNVADFATAALSYVVINEVAATKTETAPNDIAEDATLTVNLTNEGLGYYLIYPVGADNALEDDEGNLWASICSLTVSNPEQQITIKAEKPTIDKKIGTFDTDQVKETTARIGEVVPFIITGKVPNTAGFSEYIYKVTDTMGEGLQFNSDVTVKINGNLLLKTEYDVDDEPENATFVVELPLLNADGTAKYGVGAKIEIEYTGTITGETLVLNETNNTATLTYGDPSYTEDVQTTTPSDVKIYTSTIEINKVNKDGEALEGAKFVLMSGTKYFAQDETTKVVSWVDDIADALKVETELVEIENEDGTTTKAVAKFEGLADGTYSLVETEAPAGYNKLAAPIEVIVEVQRVEVTRTVDGVTTTEEIKAGELSTYTDEGWEQTDAEPAHVTLELQTVTNLTGAELPETGGMGTTLFYIVGGLLVVGAGILLVTKKRMSSDDEA